MKEHFSLRRHTGAHDIIRKICILLNTSRSLESPEATDASAKRKLDLATLFYASIVSL